MKIPKKLIFSLVLFSFLILIPNKVSALDDDYKIDNILNYSDGSDYNIYDYTVGNDTYGNGEYAITNYKIDINVNENNTFDITEYITAYFNIEKHGIFRKLPLSNTINRLDGTTARNHAKITNIEVDGDVFTKYNENGYKVIKIGDPKATLTGAKEYLISYTYNIGKDTGKNYDEFYFNIIGDEWDTTLNGIEFSITMPKEFDESKLGFSSGYIGLTDSSNIIYNVDGNTITGVYYGTLEAEEALTVRLELPEGYFVGASNSYDIILILSFIIPILCLIISTIIWYIYGKGEKVVETVEFYPPEGFNSAEIGFLYNGSAESKDVVSLLIYLANKGYISISETEENALFSKTKGFKIRKLKEYDGNNINEKLFLTGLFKNKKKSSSSDEIEEVTSSDLYDSFYITLGKIVRDLNQKENKHKIFEKNSLNKSIYFIFMLIISFIIINLIPLMSSAGLVMLPMLFFPALGFTVLFGTFFGGFKIPKLFGLIWGGMFGGIPWAFIILPGILMDQMCIYSYIIGMVAIFGILMLLCNIKKRTPYGNEMLGKIKGFKTFLETAEKSKLEQLVMENPTYFYNILPYTYVLGVSDKWIKKFETIAIESPDWYDSPNHFSMNTFGNFVDTTMKSASSVMSSSPSSSDSGGGSSGGGSGGGGGGSW